VAPALGRVADTESSSNLAGEATPLQVLDGTRAGLELLAVVVGGAREHVGNVAWRAFDCAASRRSSSLRASSGTVKPTCCARSATTSRKGVPVCS